MNITSQNNQALPLQHNRKFESRVALTTSILAVALAISTIFSNQVGDDLIIFKSKSNNEWSRYQAKSIKQNIFEVQCEQFQLDLENEGISEQHKQRIAKKVAFFQKEMTRYEQEKTEIKKEALKHEKIYEAADKKGLILDMAEAFYQISIVLSAISIISRSGVLWLFSIILGSSGISITTYALFMA